MNKAEDIIKETDAEFSKTFGRSYGNGLVEVTNDDAENVIITMGTLAGTIKHVLEKEKIRDIKLIRLKSFRPFPEEELKKPLDGISSVGVMEKDVSPGLGGALFAEMRGLTSKPTADFICGLGGRDVTVNEIKDIFNSVRKKSSGIRWVGSKL